jgi:hypothetical protein
MSIISRFFHFSPLVVLFVAVITVTAGAPQAIRAEQSSTSELEVIDENDTLLLVVQFTLKSRAS